jgi:hypothetical protein
MKGLGLWCLSPLTTIFQSVLLVEETGVPQVILNNSTTKNENLLARRPSLRGPRLQLILVYKIIHP